MVTKIFQLLLLISPIVIGSNINIDMLDLIFFRIGAIILFMASLFDEPKRKIPKEINILSASLLGLFLWNSFVHNFNPIVLSHFMNLFLSIICMNIIYVYADTNHKFIKFILLAGLINLAFFCMQKIWFDPLFDGLQKGIEGSFIGNNARMITYFAVIAPFAFFYNKFLIFLILPLAFFTRQYTIFIPLIISLPLLFKSRKKVIIFFLLIGIGAFFIRSRLWDSAAVRLNCMWQPALSKFFDRPLVGYGMGVNILKDIMFMMNSYLQIIIGLGISGLIWFGYAFKIILKKMTSGIESIALISLFIIMFFEYPIELPRLWFLIIAILAMFLIKQVKINEQCC